jgi:LEA14-like dessication related protein
MNKHLFFLLALSVSFFSGCSTLNALVGGQKPDIALSGVQFGEVNLQTATLLFDVEVSNPYDIDLPLLNMEYALKTQQSPLFNGNADIQTTVPAGKTQTVSLPITLSYKDVINAFKELKGVRPGSIIPYDATANISTKVPVLGMIKVPVRQTGQLKVPTLQDAASWDSLLNTLQKISTQ